MRVENLEVLDAGFDLESDLVIVGSGPAAYAIAQEFRGAAERVLVLESGVLKENASFAALNRVESVGEPCSGAQAEKRRRFHGTGSPFWSHDTQAFGVRCRVLGGSTEAWSGKSAAFDPIDYAKRDWAPNSGWPLSHREMEPYVARAAELLNLGPQVHDERLWPLLGRSAPEPALDPDLLRSFFWQFARSRADRLDLVRFGRAFRLMDAPNLRILVNATVTRLIPDDSGRAIRELEVSTLDGARRRVRAKVAVLAAGAIENPRLLLASARATGHSMGNQHGAVGRYLLDHPSATVGRFAPPDCSAITRRFGFYSLSRHGQVHMYMHGLVLSPEIQRRERLLNCAAYMMEDRSPDDPWGALKRLIRWKSKRPAADLTAAFAGSGLLATGLCSRLLASKAPAALTGPAADALVRIFPNLAAREYLNRGVPHKLSGISVDAITEQSPHPESRLTLGEETDRLGVPVARVDWRIGDEARATLVRMGQLMAREFPRAGLPAPTLEPWVAEERPQDGPIIDMAHTAGATRMSADPRSGVVDADCRVHGLANLYVAGGSVFPTSGHANPTLMIVALALRLADHLKSTPFSPSRALAANPR